MTTTAATGTLVHIDPKTIIVGTNVRLNARLDKDFIASIRDRGVLVPVVGHLDDDGQFVVLYGQRRTLAAVQTDLPTIPAYVVASQDEADRLIDQMAENDHRAAITATERAHGYEQLAAIGLTADQIASRTARPKDEVTAGLAVAASQLATKAAEKWDFLTLEHAAALAEFEDDKEAVESLTVAAKNGRFDHALQRLRDDRVEAQMKAEHAATLTEQGLTVIAKPAYDDKKILPGGRIVHDGKNLTEKKHAKCPGHAVYVEVDTRWVWVGEGDDRKQERVSKVISEHVCTDYAKHGHTDRWASSGSSPKKAAVDMTDEEREEAKAQRRDVIDSNKAWNSAETVRRAWITNFLTRKTPPTGSAKLIAVTFASHASALSDWKVPDLLDTFLGGKTDREARAARAEAASEPRAAVLALGHVLAAYENLTGTHSWRNVDKGTARYLTFLAANGYELSDVEKRAAGIDATA